ncbi:hypothetical protein [Taklimakanibacter lacteus]|uniref:hypothetical protein n=1 Tax=Taklimakanibacter lacteus TaxID=2268456 RepID=UPI000E65FACF
MGDSLQHLDREITHAHACGDKRRLAHLYAGAAERFAAEGEMDRAAFLLVNAYVWALDAGEDMVAAQARKVLMEMGREH